MKGSSRPVVAIAALFAIIAIIGDGFLGWEFGGTSQSLPFAIGAIAVIFAVVLVIRNR